MQSSGMNLFYHVFSVVPRSIGVDWISNFDPAEIGIGATALHVAAVRGHEDGQD